MSKETATILSMMLGIAGPELMSECFKFGFEPNSKPVWYHEHLSTKERKGKTTKELRDLRKKKYEERMAKRNA